MRVRQHAPSPVVRRRRRGSAALAVAAALLLALLVPTSGAAATADGPPALRVVQFDDDASAAERGGLVAAVGGQVVETGAGDFVVVAVSESEEAALDAAREVDGVEPLVPMHASAAPNDPLYRFQWHLPVVQAEEAWEASTGEGAVVAVLDSGVAVYPGQPTPAVRDLAGTRLAPGFDVVDGDRTPQDLLGHGTAVAGVVAATTGDGYGAAGLARDATIMPVRVLDGAGAGNDYDVARGIRLAVDAGAHVVNLSLGGEGGSSVLADAVAYAEANDVLVVAASGNEYATQVSFPAAYPTVLAVGATGQQDRLAPYSNTGSALDLVAPGGNTAEDLDRDGYADGVLQETLDLADPTKTCFCFEQGTSFSTPLVAAAAALLVAEGVAEPAELRRLLTTSARDLGTPGPDASFGAGLVQPAAALALVPPAPSPSTSPSGSPTPSPSVTPSSSPTPSPSVTPSPSATTSPGDDEAPVPPSTGQLDDGALPTVTGGAARSLVEACPAGAFPRGRFPDVDPLSPHALAIDCVAAYGITAGLVDGGYGPAGPVERDQMASFLVRLLAAAGVVLPSDAPDAFTDDDGSTHEVAIDRLAAVGVVRGRADRSYDPDAVVDRAAMTAFLTRTFEAATGDALTSDADYFDDDGGSAHEAAIDAAAEYGIAAGTAPGTFRPGLPVRRDQMASFLARTLAALAEVGDVERP